MMDDALRDVLVKHWQILVRYINPTTNLINVLVEDKVLPSAMIEDIKKGATRREKNEILLKSIRLRGNNSYRKFREAMMKCGQVFIADLLFEEESNKYGIVEENDLASIPSLKLSLTPEEMKQLVQTLDAKIRCKILKNEWKKDSQRRLDILQARSDEYKAEKHFQTNFAEQEQQIKQLTTELNVKNDIIRSLSLDINVLNQEVLNFTQRNQSKSGSRPSTPTSAPTPRSHSTDNCNTAPRPNRQGSQGARALLGFRFFEKAMATVTERLNSVLGENSSSKDNETPCMDLMENKVAQVQQVVKDLEARVKQMLKDKEDALQLLLPGRKLGGMSIVQGVQRFVMQEQKYRYSLLKDIDRLSRKLRGMTTTKPNSGLYALKQSAVTGKPSPEMIDFRFLSNHVSLLEADAEHLYKKLEWRDAEVKALKTEVATLRKRFNCPRDLMKGKEAESSQCD